VQDNAIVQRRVHPGAGVLHQISIAAHVIAMAMRVQDGGQMEARSSRSCRSWRPERCPTPVSISSACCPSAMTKPMLLAPGK